MVHVACIGLWRTTALPSKRAVGIDQIDQCVARSQLRETQITSLSFHLATENVSIEVDHPRKIVRADHDVIDRANVYGVLVRHDILLLKPALVFWMIVLHVVVEPAQPIGGRAVTMSLWLRRSNAPHLEMGLTMKWIFLSVLMFAVLAAPAYAGCEFLSAPCHSIFP
jgi:hypothetical protein